jgi:hypothetical protein
MMYSTKFDIGQVVWAVRDTPFQQIVKCAPCGNTGAIHIGAEEFICPKCHGKAAYAQTVGNRLYVAESSKIGKIQIEDESGRHRWSGDTAPDCKISYMIESTGVGSGQVWDEAQLFALESEAQDFCDCRNGLLPASECELGRGPIDAYGKVLPALRPDGRSASNTSEGSQESGSGGEREKEK